MYADVYYMRRPRRRKRCSPGRILLKTLKIILLILLAVIVCGGVIGIFYVRQTVQDAPDISQITIAPTESASYIYDSEGNKTLKLTLPESNRDLVTIDKIPADLQHAFVAIEDARFYQHNGVDVRGIIRAAWTGLKTGSFSEGASTITQQLLKNTVFTDWTRESTFKQRLDRKIQEQYLAIKLEKVLNKDQILEDYLNVINLGAGCYGVQAASYKYFGKDVSELTLSESTVIAGITQNPTKYNPITHPEDNATRRQKVLDAMLDQNWIDSSEYEKALADDVYSRIQSNNISEESSDSSSSVYTYYEDSLINQVIEDLQAVRGYTYKQAYKAVYTGGLSIYSAQDDAVQAICDEEFANGSNFPDGTEVGIDYALSVSDSSGQITDYGNDDLRSWVRKNVDSSFDLMCSSSGEARDLAAQFKAAMTSDASGTSDSSITVLGERVTITPQPQSSAVVIDQKTGYVKAVVGGRGTKDASLTLNRATYTTRQPGSTFKILAVYAPFFNEKMGTLATMFNNEETQYSDGTAVSNWDLNNYTGRVTVRDAITSSINVIAVQAVKLVTPPKAFEYCENFGISTLTDSYSDGSETYSDMVEPLALGGITRGVTNLDLTGAYAAIANGGKYREPKFYTKVLDQKGNVILDNTEPAERSVISEQAAYLLTSAMEDVISDPEGTAYGLIDPENVSLAGKSGTTSDYRDIWFTGFSPYYTLTVWGGYDNNAQLPDEGIYHKYNKVLWNSIMKRLNENEPAADFTVPDGIIKLNICSESGQIAVLGCSVIEEYFDSSCQPATYCSIHGSGQPVTTENAITIVNGGSTQIGAQTQIPSETGASSDTNASGNASGNTDGNGNAGGGITIYNEDQYTIPSGSGTFAGSAAAGSISGTSGNTPDTPATAGNTGSTQADPSSSGGTGSTSAGNSAAGTPAGSPADNSGTGSASAGSSGSADAPNNSGIIIYSQDEYSGNAAAG